MQFRSVEASYPGTRQPEAGCPEPSVWRPWDVRVSTAARLKVPDAPKLHGTVTTTRACDFEPCPGATPTFPIGPLAVGTNLEVAAVRLRRVGKNDARVADAGDPQRTRVQMDAHQRAVSREEAEALMGVDGHALAAAHVGGVVKTKRTRPRRRVTKTALLVETEERKSTMRGKHGTRQR